jgi:dynamin 1-like protein
METAIRMHEGDGLPGFPSVDVFIYLINPQLEKLRDPALELIQDTYQQLEQIAHGIVDKIFQRFPSMVPEIMDIIVKVLSAERDRAREVVEAIIDSEQNYLFTNDQDYRDNRTEIMANDFQNQPIQQVGPDGQPVLQQPMGMNQPGGQPKPISRQRGGNAFVNELRTRIDSYFDIVLKSVKDSIPKSIGYFLVRKSQDSLQFELYNQVNQNRALSSSLGEPAMITERRLALNTLLKTLKNSLKVLQRDPE